MNNKIKQNSMNTYVIFTTEGYCSAPDHQDIDVYQLLGFVDANSLAEAENRFLDDNPVFLEAGYTEFTVIRLHDSENIMISELIK